MKPLRVCTRPGCPVLTPHGRCGEHRIEQRVHGNRFTVGAYGRPWRRLRDAHRARSPFCVECAKAGQVVVGTQVDHIVPHRGDRVLLMDPRNLQTLCDTHHGQKTAAETRAMLYGTP
jgi:5-methylcytosine-specific restriction enzyme A